MLQIMLSWACAGMTTSAPIADATPNTNRFMLPPGLIRPSRRLCCGLCRSALASARNGIFPHSNPTLAGRYLDDSSTPRERRVLCEIPAYASEHRVGQSLLIAVVAQPLFFVGIGNKRGFDQDRWHIGRLQHGESGLLDVVLVQRIDFADFFQHEPSELE